MSTHSLICIKDKYNQSVGVYCHSDGYIENNGFILQTFYNTPEKVKELVALGDLSRLGLEIGQKIDYDQSIQDKDYYLAHKYQCVAYHRDREETLNQYKNNFAVLWKRASESYNYVYCLT